MTNPDIVDGFDCTKKYESNGQRVYLCYIDRPLDRHEDYPVVGIVGDDTTRQRWTLEGKSSRDPRFDLVRVKRGMGD